MNIDINKVGHFFKAMAKKGMVVSMLLAIIGNMLLQMIIPGTTLIEVIGGVLLTVVIILLNSQREEFKSFLSRLDERCPA